jgi:hypothetical protein
LVLEKDYVGYDACSRPPIISKSHDLHIGDIRRDVGEIDSSLPFLVPMGCASFALFLAFPFFLLVMVSAINLLLDFCDNLISFGIVWFCILIIILNLRRT